MTDDGEELENSPSPIKPHSLKNFVKEQSDMRVGGDAIDLLQHHMEFVAGRIWLEASKHAEEDERKTVKERDVQHAIDVVIKPHDLIKETSQNLDHMKEIIDELLERSPLYAENRYDD